MREEEKPEEGREWEIITGTAGAVCTVPAIPASDVSGNIRQQGFEL